MFGLLLLLLLVVPFVELFLIVEVWQSLGGLTTLALLVGISLLGAWMVKREGGGVWLRLNRQLAEGRLPTDELIDGALVLFAGALLLTPGFLTDAIGLLLLFPPSRAGMRALARRRIRRRVERGDGAIRVVTFGGGAPGGWGTGGAGFGRGAEVVDVDGRPVGDERSQASELGP